MRSQIAVLAIVCTVALTGTVQAAVGEAKQKADGAVVCLVKKSVTLACPGFFHVQEADCSAGIRVDGATREVKPGDSVDVVGTLRTDPSGERYIAAETVTVTGSAPALTALGFRHIDLGGWSWRWMIGPDGKPALVWTSRGMPAFGLLTRTWGRVTEADPGGAYLFMDDGSHLLNYTKTHRGVKLLAVEPFAQQFPVGAYVAATGVVGIYLDETTGDQLPMIIAPRLADITVVPESPLK